MRPTKPIACGLLAAVLVLGPGSTTFAATMDFDSVPFGTVFGSTAVPTAHTPGEVVFSQDDISMSVENFFFESFTGFFEAEVGGRYAGYFPTPPLELNNISVRFDFTSVGFDVDLVTFEYMEFGGVSNLAANGGPIHELGSLHEVDGTMVGPNAMATVTAGDTVTPGLVTLTGDIDTLRIGGQELVIDSIIAIPEPATVVLLGVAGAAILLRRRHPVG